MYQIFRNLTLSVEFCTPHGCQNPAQDALGGPPRCSCSIGDPEGAQIASLVLPEDWLERTKPLFPGVEGHHEVSRRVPSPFWDLFRSLEGVGMDNATYTDLIGDKMRELSVGFARAQAEQDLKDYVRIGREARDHG